MSAKYKNLPGISLELLDGNLRIDENPEGPVTLVIGTAYSGPSNVQYLVRDRNVAAAVFGADSPLIKRATEVNLGGAKNVVLYRIGGVSASVEGLFGPESELFTTDQTVVAGSKYKVYIGPQPANPSKSCLIAFENGRIVYSNVPGSEVDVGKINVVGFSDTFNYIVGTPTAPVAIENIIANLKAASTVTASGDGTKVKFAVTGSTSTSEIASVTVDLLPVTNFTVGETAGVKDITFDVAPANAAAISIKYATPATVPGVKYVAGNDSMSASQKALYELLDRAYADLETTIATHVVVDGATLDAPNIADGSTAVDKLEYLHKTEEFGEVTYEWGSTKVLYKKGAATTVNVAEADVNTNGQPIVAKRFNEVNFAHQLASWCQSISENERFVLASIGTSLPAATTTASVARWVGTLPQTDFAGVVVANGSGLLGNRFMSGSTTQRPGFYKTDSGFPDGNAEVDSNGAVVDIGKFLSVVPAVIATPNAVSLGSTARLANGAAMYLGLLSTIRPGNSTTNEILQRVSLPFVIKKQKLDELAGSGFVMFQEKTRGTVVVSGELATGPDSDYDYVSTSIIVGDLMTKIRDRLEGYIGKGTDQVMVAAMETAVEGIFNQAAKNGEVVKYAFNVIVEPVRNGAGRIRIPFTIVPPFELREVSVSMKLAYDI